MTDLEVLGMLADRGISVKMLSATTFEVDGFYKSGTVEVDTVFKTIRARYDDVIDYSDLEDALVNLNYSWWKHSKDRFESWKNPDPRWAPLLEEHGYVKKTVKTVVEYE